MKINKYKDLKNIILPLNAMAFFIAVFFSYEKLKNAVDFIRSNKYIHHKMFRLAALHLKKPLIDLIITILLVNIMILIGYVFWKFFLTKTFTIKLDFRTLNKKRLKIYFIAAYLLGVVFYCCSKYFSERDQAPGGSNILKLLITIGILLLLGWVLFTVKWGKIFKTKNSRIIGKATVFVTLLLFIFTAAAAVYTGMVKEPADPNIILIVVDCLRADRLGCLGCSRETSPFLDELSRDGILFKNAYSNSPWTKPSVASILTSLYPHKHNTVQMPNMLPGEALTIFEILKNEGYHTLFFNGGNPHLTGKFNFDQGVDSYISGQKATELTKQFLSYLPGKKKSKFFAYIHYMDLHLPYTQNPYYAEFLKNSEHSFFRTRKILVDDIRLYTEKNCLSPDEKKDIIALYDSQVRFVDSAVKEIAATLKKKNLYRDTLIIVTSDHGEEFWDHNNFEHGHTVYNELLHVPIIMAGNRLKHAVIKKPVNLIDILPTLLHFAHISVANLHISGKNLLKGSPKPIFSLGTLYGDEKYCLIKDNMKIIRNTGRKKGKKGLAGYRSNEKFELYDLAIDPFETHNLRLEKPDLFLKLKKELQKYKKSGDPLIGKKILPEKDSELKEKLKSLGYL